MAGQDLSLFYQILNSVESRGKFFGVQDIRRFGAYLIAHLGEGRAAQLVGVHRQVEVVDGAAGFLKYRLHDAPDVVAHPRRGNDHGAGRQDLIVRVFLFHRQAVFSGGNIDAESDAEIGSSLYGFIQAGVFPLVAAGPHPVGGEGNGAETLFQRRPDEVGQRFGDSVSGAGRRVDQPVHRSVPDGSRHAIVCIKTKGHGSAIVEGELQRPGALLFGHQPAHTAVHLIGQPVFAGDGFQFQHLFEVLVQALRFIIDLFEAPVHLLIIHDRFR